MSFLRAAGGGARLDIGPPWSPAAPLEAVSDGQGAALPLPPLARPVDRPRRRLTRACELQSALAHACVVLRPRDPIPNPSRLLRLPAAPSRATRPAASMSSSALPFCA